MVKLLAIAVAFLSSIAVAQAAEVDDLLSMVDQSPSVKRFEPIYHAKAKARREVLCLALNMYHEARADLVKAPEGVWGVGFVTLNRLHRPEFPKTICDIVFQQTTLDHLVKVRIGKKVSEIQTIGQFSWTVYKLESLVPREKDAWYVIQAIAWDLYTKPHLEDVTKGATHFFAPKLVQPKWNKRAVEEVQLGGHKFMQLAAKTP